MSCNKKNIGVLGFQGAIVEHQQHIERLGHRAIIVRYPEQLDELDGIILPGGESTTMGKLLHRTKIMEPLRDKIKGGLPAWGTCAGMILLAKEIENDLIKHLALMDIVVKRNAYGTQIDSFNIDVNIQEVSEEPIPLVFIRAPYIVRVGENVKIICKVDEQIVAASENNMLVTSFHPELTANLAFHQYFIEMCRKVKRTV